MTPLMGDFGDLVLCICVLWVFFGVFLIFIIRIYCYARTGYLRSRILSLDIPVFDTPFYIYIITRWLSLFVTLSIGVLRFKVAVFCLPLFLQRLLVIINHSYYYTY